MLAEKYIARMRLWTKMLRETELKQGNGALQSIDTDTDTYEYCCLGIACLVPANDPDETIPAQFHDGETGHNLAAPNPEVDQWFLGPVEFRPVFPNGNCVTLFQLPLRIPGRSTPERPFIEPWEANDEFGLSFGSIADAIDGWLDDQEAETVG